MTCRDYLDIASNSYASITLSIFSALIVLGNVVSTMVFVLWRFPLLTKVQNRALLNPTRRFVFFMFWASIVLFEGMALHSWRILPGDSVCYAEPSWILLWIGNGMLCSINIVIACSRPPYTLVMLYTNTVSTTYAVYFYVFMVLSHNNICGTLFISIPVVFVGIINVYMVPEMLTLVIPKKPDKISVVDEALNKIGLIHIEDSADGDSVRFCMNKDAVSRMGTSFIEETSLVTDTQNSEEWVEMSEF